MLEKLTTQAKTASRKLVTLSSEEKNEAIRHIGKVLWQQRETILSANEKDLDASRKQGLTESKLDRLRLDETRIQDMITGLEQIADLADPVGQSLQTIERPNGLTIEQIRVPFGVIGIIYESRPNVTVDAAGLTLKTGNAVILRGGKEAINTNIALVNALRDGLKETSLPEDAIQIIQQTERQTIEQLIRSKGKVDLIIPRGGAGLIQYVLEHSLVPVIETGVGNCHVYVDKDANLQMALDIAINAKVQRPSVCNAIESLLVHEQIAPAFLPALVPLLKEKGVTIRGCEQTQALLPNQAIEAATEIDFDTEFLDLILAIKVVKNTEEAISHIDRFGTNHSEAIVTDNQETANQFLTSVDAAAVYHNASTRFTDGFEFGFGAEIGISTQKLHARGPMGLKELTSYKYLIHGNGQIRE
ncbi:glutamate-5-semialdehyde dehydrogenase [Shimazuella sp. AN120528]|uniref:glutamate-5-semialdehyde dehydrogenase n=1 Tax=Shimazuella soli TaxID=1892854 RepID=UPI001F0EACD1|nr:glutamate-5-semialdehyde dehydrogenase [Shimazuella soli]MCH5585325.1 glutamate-5-semialdehyde dehydrogenase [Shimazuella soli]